MKLRYYLRGLGLGILVTAAFFIASNSKDTMTDAEVKARAKELGMIENTVLTDLESSTEVKESIVEVESSEVETEIEVSTVEETTVMESTTEETTTEETTTEETTMEETTTVAELETEEDTNNKTAVENKENEPASTDIKNTGNGTEVIVTVNRGDGSDTVARRLQELGVIPDAGEFDRFLMQNGYDRKISTGEHIIPANASWDEIGRTLCNM